MGQLDVLMIKRWGFGVTLSKFAMEGWNPLLYLIQKTIPTAGLIVSSVKSSRVKQSFQTVLSVQLGMYQIWIFKHVSSESGHKHNWYTLLIPLLPFFLPSHSHLAN